VCVYARVRDGRGRGGAGRGRKGRGRAAGTCGDGRFDVVWIAQHIRQRPKRLLLGHQISALQLAILCREMGNETVRVCSVCVRARERVCVLERVCVYVRESVSLCKRKGEREEVYMCVCVCVCVCEGDGESQRTPYKFRHRSISISHRGLCNVDIGRHRHCYSRSRHFEMCMRERERERQSDREETKEKEKKSCCYVESYSLYVQVVDCTFLRHILADC
jgi:hypothetical protein